MKTLLSIPLMFLILFATGCDEDDDISITPQLTGDWFYRSDTTQVLNFDEPGIVSVNGNPFEYEILDNNVLELNYVGPLFILLPITKHSVSFDSNGGILQIDNLENLHFFTEQTGEDEFER
ncbi:MAG: hypothetical protein AAFQ94_04695 [Bacteroidota bacterium]